MEANQEKWYRPRDGVDRGYVDCKRHPEHTMSVRAAERLPYCPNCRSELAKLAGVIAAGLMTRNSGASPTGIIEAALTLARGIMEGAKEA